MARESSEAGGSSMPEGNSMPLGDQHAQGNGIKGSTYIAAFHEIEDQLLSGFEFKNDSPYHWHGESLTPPYQQ
jgi:hypothetical protein